MNKKFDQYVKNILEEGKKFERCVKKVKKQRGVDNPYAICNASLKGKIDEEESTVNEGGKCTKPTKKASSTAKGKKWMQCVKNPSGKGYKRVHWGQKGVKVTGKSGDTKRKKSFRARHKCSKAKKGTAQYQACKDW